MQLVLRISILAILYGLAGRLAFTLAIPSGFATPVWPAAGLALAFVMLWGYRVLPGVLIGSFITNFLLAYEGGHAFWETASLMIATGISFGAVFQAYFATFLLRRMMAFPTTLSLEKDIISVFLIGGAVGCLVNSIWSPIVLSLAGFIAWDEFLINSFTWWVGDTIGVVLFTPMTLLLLSPQVSNLRKTIVTLPICLVSVLTIVLFFNAKELHEQDYRSAFKHEAKSVTSQLEKTMDSYLNVLIAHERFISASNKVTAHEFSTFSLKFTELFPNVHALSWNPKVVEQDRVEFVKSIRKQGFDTFDIKERIDGEMKPLAGTRDVYFPVTYLVPYEDNKRAHGFDTYAPDDMTNDIRTFVLDRAKITGRAQSTGSISIVQAQDDRGLLIYQPVFDAQKIRGPAVERNLIGYVAGVFMINKILQPIGQEARNNGLDILIVEEPILAVDTSSAEVPESVLFDSRTPSEISSAESPQRHQYHEVVNIAGQNWHVYVHPTQNGMLDQSYWGLWYLLVGGLFFVGIFGGVLLVVSMKTEGISAQIEENELFDTSGESKDRMYILPVITTCLILMLSFALYIQLSSQQERFVEDTLSQRYELIKRSILDNVSDSVIALRRMGQRWEDRSRTPEGEWRADSQHYIEDYKALKAVEWIDDTYHIRWVEPLDGNETVLGMNIAFDEQREKSLRGAARQNAITLTPPLKLVQGYRGMIAYIPLHINDKFDGFMAGVFDIDMLVQEILQDSLNDTFYVEVHDGADVLFTNAGDHHIQLDDYKYEQYISVFGRSWKILLWSSRGSSQQNYSLFPKIVLMGGVLVSFLIGVIVYFSMVSRRQSVLLNNRAVLLEENEKKYRALTEQTQLVLDSAGEGVVGIDLDGFMTFANTAAENTLGYRADEMLHMTMHDLIHYAYPDGSLYPYSESKIQETTRHGRAHKEDKEVFWHKSGRAIPVEYTSTPIYDADGVISGAVIVFRDISDRQKIEREREAYTKELEEAKEKAMEANLAKSNFLAGMSHEIRTPMNGVLGTVELLNETKLSQKQRKYVDIIRNSGKTLLEIINEILDYSKIEAGKFELYEDTYDLEKAVEEQVMLLQPLAAERSLYYKWSFDSSLPRYVVGDAVRTSQVLTNFISNAIKFTPSGGITITVEQDPDKEGFMQFSVEDTGIGIPEASIDAVFGAFEQVMEGRKAAKTAGTGLGLAIAKHLVELMGGEIGLESTEGKGSQFWFSLPIKEASKEQIDELNAHDFGVDDTVTFDATLLVVEDVITNQFVVKTMLTNMGCRVDLASNGGEAIEMISKSQYDLVFMDCNMPVMDGFEATTKLREMGYSDIPVVALTANAIEGDRERCLEAGMNDFVTKPVEKRVIVDALNKWLPS